MWAEENKQQYRIKNKYSSTPTIRTPVIRIANNPDWRGPSSKHFLPVIVLHFFMVNIFPQLSHTYKEICESYVYWTVHHCDS